MKYILNKMNKYVYLKSFITLMRLGVLLLRGFSIISIESHYIKIFILIVIVTPLQKKYE